MKSSWAVQGQKTLSRGDPPVDWVHGVDNLITSMDGAWDSIHGGLGISVQSKKGPRKQSVKNKTGPYHQRMAKGPGNFQNQYSIVGLCRIPTSEFHSKMIFLRQKVEELAR